VLPANSIAQPVPPAVPMRPITASATSFAVTPRDNGPSIVTRMFFIFFAIGVVIFVFGVVVFKHNACKKAVFVNFFISYKLEFAFNLKASTFEKV
jgi:hypothetical protein